MSTVLRILIFIAMFSTFLVLIWKPSYAYNKYTFKTSDVWWNAAVEFNGENKYKHNIDAFLIDEDSNDIVILFPDEKQGKHYYKNQIKQIYTQHKINTNIILYY